MITARCLTYLLAGGQGLNNQVKDENLLPGTPATYVRPWSLIYHHRLTDTLLAYVTANDNRLVQGES